MKAVFYACRAMHASLSGKGDGQQNSFCHCERASGHLWNSLNVSGATSDPSLNHVSGDLTPSRQHSGLVCMNVPTPTLPSLLGCLRDTEATVVVPFPEWSLLRQVCLLVPGASMFVPSPLLGSLNPRSC